LSEAYARKICKIMDLALKRARRSSASTIRAARAFKKGSRRWRLRRHLPAQHGWASGVIPQLSATSWAVRGRRRVSPAITDFIFMVESSSYMFITIPT